MGTVLTLLGFIIGLLQLAGVVSMTTAIVLGTMTIAIWPAVFHFERRRQGKPGLQAWHIFIGGLVLAGAGFVTASVAAIFLYQSRESRAFAQQFDLKKPDDAAAQPPPSNRIDEEFIKAQSRIAELQQQNRELQKHIDFEKQKLSLPVEAQMIFQFSEPPIIRHKLTPAEAEQLLSALNELMSFIAESRPAISHTIFPEYLIRRPHDMKIPLMAERQEGVTNAVRAYSKIRDRLVEITSVHKVYASDLNIIIGDSSAMTVLANALGALNNIDSRLGIVLKNPSPDDDERSRFMIFDEVARSKISILKAEDWVQRLLTSRASAAREEIRKYL